MLSTGGHIMAKFKSTKASSAIQNMVERLQAGENKRLNRHEKRKLKKLNQGKKDA
jgi:hypothetical protein